MTAPATTERVATLVPARRPAWAVPVAVLLLCAVLALAAGLAFARPVLRVAVTDPPAARTLVNFGIIERNDQASYRWSLPRSELALGGLERRPVLLTLRMAAPRPVGAGRAVTYLADDQWHVGDFIVAPEWRRYHVLLPPATGALKLRAEPFVPGENDQRRLGVALTALQAQPALTTSADVALAILDFPRVTTLVLLPLAAYATMALLVPRRRQDTQRILLASCLRAFVPSCYVLLAAVSAATPLGAAMLLPAGWPLPVALALALGLAAAEPMLISMARQGAMIAERTRLALVLLFALGQGLLFLVLMPPWQHYDEPAHFEYARQLLDSPAADQLLQREITASMIEHGFYAPEIPVPPLLDDDGSLVLSGGGSAAGHQPWYYLLVDLPLRMARFLDVTSQLYVARAVSLALLLVTVAAASGVAAELRPPGHWLRWLLPLVVASLAPFVDLMTAVNNDVPTAAFTSLFAWGAVRTARRGLSWRNAALVLASALAAALVKSTGAVVLALVPLVLVVALWARRGWRWRWLLAAASAVLLGVGVLVVRVDDASHWYRWSWPAQAPATRAAVSNPPFGTYALRLEIRPDAYLHRLSAPVLPQELPALRGRRVTIGGWLWATRPTTATLGLLYHQDRGGIELGREFAVTTEPRFVAWIAEVPADVWRLQYMLAVAQPSSEPLDVYLDGAVLVRGRFPPDLAPSFDADAASGTWAGRSFANLLRNASAEDAGPRVQPALDQLLSRYARRPLSPWLMSIADLDLGARATLMDVIPSLLDGLFGRVGWGWEPLTGPGWHLVWRALALAALLGCVRWLWSRRRTGDGPALALLAALAIGVWGLAVLRIHPLVESGAPLTSARYVFPAIIPTMLALVAGFVALWPRRHRAYAVALSLAGLLLLQALIVSRLWEFYRG